MAGVSAKELKGRIRSMRSTRQITKAMEMVATAQLRRAQTQLSCAQPYFTGLSDTLADIAAGTKDFSSPYLVSSSAGQTLTIVIAGDRGLAGGYNSSLLQLAAESIAQTGGEVLPIGKKAAEYFHTHGGTVFTDGCAEAAAVSVGDCFTLARQICAAYRSGRYREVKLVYTHFINMLSQAPQCKRVLPLDAGGGRAGTREIIYDPDPVSVFDAIIPEYVGGLLYGALCDSRACELSARRMAMDNATRNADDRIDELSLQFNRARQAAITQQITEIVAGS